ncbi:unnamed protein product [Mycena citricolor]|uniref:Pkinase-domain-containing protein n=1 Tax=Mycena citricolor TaxID=2018698 RepID=A0AAD2H413_9AGAR|nr:unnamed protein product [Mycena citricolor]
MATTVVAPVNVPASTSSHYHIPSHRTPSKSSATPGASSSRSTFQNPSATIKATVPESAPKTFHRIRSSLEQSLRTATRSKKTIPTPDDDFATLSPGTVKGKERATEESKEKAKPLWNFRRTTRQPPPSPSPSPGPDRSDTEHGEYISPTLRQGSVSSPALHIYSQALPSPNSHSAIAASSSSNSDALVSPTRTKRPSLQPVQRHLSELPPSTPRVTRHRSTKSNPLNSVAPPVSPPPTRVVSSPQTPRRATRDLPASPPDTPTPASGSRGHIGRSSSSASVTHLPSHTAGLPASASRGTSPVPIRSRSPSRRVVTPLRGLSSPSGSHHLAPSPSPTAVRRTSIDSPRRPSFRDESPSPSLIRPRDRPSSQQRGAYSHRQFNASTTSLASPSNPEHRDLIRTATSMLCKEVIKPPPHMARTDAGMRDWQEVEVRVRALSRLERIWGKSGVGGSSSNITLGTPSGISVAGEERERRLFTEALRDGFVLCQLINKLRSSSVVRPDVRDDGFVRTSNITKFLAACSSYGLAEEDLFQRDDLIEGTSESLARVAHTIITLIKYVDAPRFSNQKSGSSASPYGPGSSRVALSTPNLHSTAPLASPVRPRWTPPADLSHGGPDESSGEEHLSKDDTATLNAKTECDRPSPIDRPVMRDKESPTTLALPPRSPLRPLAVKVDDDALQVSQSDSRQSMLSTSSVMTESTMMSSLLDVTRHSYKYGTIRTVTTDMTSEAPSISRAEGSSISEDLARKRVDSKSFQREAKMSETFIDLSRVEEMDEAGTASRGVGKQWEQKIDGQKIDKVRLGKGKWPDDFIDLAPPPKSPTSSELRSPSPSVLSSSGPRKIAIVGAPKRNDSAESLPQFPRRPTHRARHSIDVPPQSPSALLPKDSLLRRDSSPDGMPAGSRVIVRRHSTKPKERNGDADAAVPFPRTTSGEHSSSPPDRAASPISDRPRQPRGRFQSDLEASSKRRRPRPSSYDELGARPSRSRFESMMNLGGASGNTSASDLLSRDSLDAATQKILTVREEGKVPIHFQLANCIGRGQFGSVYRAMNLNTGQMVAVKRIRLEGLKEDEVTTLMREVDLVKRLSHPSIVKYEGMARDQDTLNIVLEYVENGSLGQTLKAFGKLNERLVASYVVKILEGLHYLHSSDVVHCDLKAANILTTKNGNVKLSDFGVSLNLRAMEREIKDVAGTPNWMAPEVIELKGASPKSDIWSLGCTVVELLTGRPPYAEIANSMSVMFRIVEDDSPPLPRDPTKRPSAEFLCEHQWLKKNWAGHKLRPQDSIPFLRRVSVDLQKSDAVRFLAQVDMSESLVDAEGLISSSPPGRRISLTSRPMDQDIVARDHSFVKTTFSKPMVCRVCLQNAKKSAVICEQCSLIAHARCAVHAPPTCDLRSQLLLYAQYAEKGNPSSAYVNPLETLPEPRPTPITAASEVAYVAHTPRTSLDGVAPSGLTPGGPLPPAFKFMAAFKRSRSNLSPEPGHASSSGSVVQLPAKDANGKRLHKHRERPQSVKSSTSTNPQSDSLRSGESIGSRSNAKSMDEIRSDEMQRKRSRLGSRVSESRISESEPVSATTAGHKKRSESRSGCVMQ